MEPSTRPAWFTTTQATVAAPVGFNNQTGDDVAKDVVMQVAAMAPVGVDEDSVPADVVAKEPEIGKELAIQEGKLLKWLRKSRKAA